MAVSIRLIIDVSDVYFFVRGLYNEVTLRPLFDAVLVRDEVQILYRFGYDVLSTSYEKVSGEADSRRAFSS